LNSPSPAVIYTFPYTTLFRSDAVGTGQNLDHVAGRGRADRADVGSEIGEHLPPQPDDGAVAQAGDLEFALHVAGVVHRHHVFARSEEHTSELQSPYDLVCRLL